MNKKDYMVPSVVQIVLETEAIMAGSDAGAHVPDVGWGSSRRRSSPSDNLWTEK